jgi:hypothetical protein
MNTFVISNCTYDGTSGEPNRFVSLPEVSTVKTFSRK